MLHNHDYVKIRQSWFHLDLESSVWWWGLVRKPWRKGAPAIPFLLRLSLLSLSPTIPGSGGSTIPFRLSFDLWWLLASSKPLLSPTTSIFATAKGASFLKSSYFSVAWLLTCLGDLARMLRILVEVGLIICWFQRKHSFRALSRAKEESGTRFCRAKNLFGAWSSQSAADVKALKLDESSVGIWSEN